MNFFRKLSYFQLKRIRRVLFAVNAGIVASIALFHSPAYILCSMLVTYSVAIFSDRLKIYVMAAHTHEITSRCTWLLDQGNVPERAKTLFPIAAKQAKTRLFSDYFPRRTFALVLLFRPFCMAIALLAVLSIAIEIFFPNLLPWSLPSSGSYPLFLSLLIASLLPLLAGQFVDARARNTAIIGNEVVALRLLEIISHMPNDETKEAYIEQQLEPSAFYKALFVAGKKMRTLSSYEDSIAKK